MYESVYLYEQLKHLTLQESYIKSLNSITESAYDTYVLEEKIKKVKKEIDEASKGRKWSLGERIKRKRNKALKPLMKFKEKAEKVKPIGLSNKKHKKIKSEKEIKKTHENAIRYLNQFDPNNDAEDTVKLFIENVKDNVIYRNVCKILNEGKCDTAWCVDNVVTAVIEKEINKKDICEAVEFLEKGPSYYNDCLPPTQIEPLTNREPYREMAHTYKKALVAIVDEAYYDMMERKVDLEFEQANQIMTKAANYNPRNLKESYLVMDYIDCIFESFQYE